MKRIQWIDVAKGIAILSVILGHMGNDAVASVVYCFHLTTFFLLSGYTMKEEEITKAYLNKKFKRLMVPYFVTCLAITVMDLVNLVISHALSVSTMQQSLQTDLLRTIFASGSVNTFEGMDLGANIGAIYFLPALFFAGILVQVLLKVPNRSMRYLVSIGLAYCAEASARFIWLPFSVQCTLLAVPVILLGYDLKEKALFEKFEWKFYVFAIGLSIYCVITKTGMLSYVVAYLPDRFMTGIISCVFAILVIRCSMFLEKSKVLSWLGTHSLQILCIHLFLLMTMDQYFVAIVGSVSFLWLMRFLCTMCICVLGTFLMEWIVQNAKVMKCLQYLMYVFLFGSLLLTQRMNQTNLFVLCIPAIVIAMGYASGDQKNSVLSDLRQYVLPYVLFSLVFLFLHRNDVRSALMGIVFGISETGKVLIDIPVVKAGGLILLVLIIDVMHRILKKPGYAFMVFVILYLLFERVANDGYWMPWSLDLIGKCGLLFSIGVLCKTYGIAEQIQERKYFVFVPLLVLLYVSCYGQYHLLYRYFDGLGMIGAVSVFTIFLYALKKPVSRKWLSYLLVIIALIQIL